MNFVPDTFESIHRRKKLAAWLATLKGPPKRDMRKAFINYAGGSGGGDFLDHLVWAIGAGGSGGGSGGLRP